MDYEKQIPLKQLESTTSYSVKYSSPMDSDRLFIDLHLISLPNDCFCFSLHTGIQWREQESEQSFIPGIAVV